MKKLRLKRKNKYPMTIDNNRFPMTIEPKKSGMTLDDYEIIEEDSK